jgi:hypothetical protein
VSGAGRGSLIAAVVSGALGLAPAGASGAILFDHVDSTPPASIVSQYPGDAPSQQAIAWDDFTVPAGEVWYPQHVFIDGSASGPATSFDTAFKLNFNTGALPDAGINPIDAEILPSGSGATYPDLDLDVHRGYDLPPGNYWLSAAAILDLGPSSNRWYWESNDDRFGDLALWQEGGGYGTGCTGTLHPRSTTCFQGSSGPDQSFRIEGVRAPAKIQVDEVKAKSKGRLTLSVELPSCCGLTVKSKRMDPHYNEGLRSIGPFVFTLDPKPKTLKKLKSGDDVTATVSLTTNALFPGTPHELKFPAVELTKKLKP